VLKRLILATAGLALLALSSIAFAGATAPLAVVGPVVSQTEAQPINAVTPMSVAVVREVAARDDSFVSLTLADPRQRWRLSWAASDGRSVDKVSPPYHPIL